MSIDEGLYAWIQEALAPLGSVSLRRMMGGATLYLDGTIFGILHDDLLWLKADAETDVVWDAAGCARFSMTFKDGRVGTMDYRRAPADAYDDADALQHWARLGAEAGTRGTAKRKPRKRKGAEPV